MIDRTKRLRRVSPTAMCYFSTPDQNVRTHSRMSSINSQVTLVTPGPSPLDFPFEAVSSLDFGQYVDSTPVSVHPHLPLETVMEMFKKLGPRVILVELRGKVCGLVTVKDVLKYQFKSENEEHPRVDSYTGIEERLWGLIQSISQRVASIWKGTKPRGVRQSLNEVSGMLSDYEVELLDRQG
jgi:chloride channel 3/4/5